MSYSVIKILKRIGLYIICSFYSVLTAGPILWLILISLKTNPEIMKNAFSLPGDPKFIHFIEVFKQGKLAIYMANSFMVVFTSLVFITIFSSMAAFAFGRYKFPGRQVLFITIFMTIIIPLQVIIFPIFITFAKVHLTTSRFGLILIYIATSLPLSIFILKGFFEQIPGEIVDAARTDGCSEWSLFWRVMLPIAGPAISTVIVFHFIFLWNEFLLANIFLTVDKIRTVPVGLMQYMGLYFFDYTRLAAATVISVIPALILYAIFSEQFIKGMSAGALKV